MRSLSLVARPRIALGAASVAIAVGVPAVVAQASILTDSAAARAAKHAATRHVHHLGLDYRYADWTAFCLKWSRGSFSCTVTTRGGKCHGRMVVYGSREHPRTRVRRISCGE